ncbi:hypothetical protein SAY87_023705 [Trapa incisa]|uniref:SBP-type domain-containing protein n=1 Tax=Trapa incisa TaxID=236973 RepID=A0AAN7QQL2_9MYRT|nr:hypothetical protein SAY87_023705 [Trapa incisa]
MESWRYISQEKEIVSRSESISPSDLLLKSNNLFPNWELIKTPEFLGNPNLVSGSQQPLDMRQGCFGVELGIQQMSAKQLPSESGSDVPTARFGGRDMIRAINTFSEEEDSTSKFSSSVVESNCRASSPFIDLKLGRFNDNENHHGSKFLLGGDVLPSCKLTTPAKRARAGGISCQTAYCQVYGCNKDLISSKDYHKRHKVCEAHSKTSKVMVNGVEQRFCQQCSRFHLLAEFDDGKRSCRRRLAGHNERRRKPQGGAHSSRNGRLIQPITAGDLLQGNTFEAASFICLPSRTLVNPEKHGTTRDILERIKFDERTGYCGSITTIPLPSRHANSNLPAITYSTCEKQFLFTQEAGLISSTSSSSGIHGGQISLPRSCFHDTPYGGNEFSGFNAAATHRGFSGNSESGCALSLLSSPSRNCNSYILSQFSNMAMGEGLNKLESSLGMNSVQGKQTGPIVIPGCNGAVNCGTEGILNGPVVLHGKDNIPCDDGPTISLSQLSSKLQRVENQRQSMQVQENDPFSVLGSPEGFDKEGIKVPDRECWLDIFP